MREEADHAARITVVKQWAFGEVGRVSLRSSPGRTMAAASDAQVTERTRRVKAEKRPPRSLSKTGLCPFPRPDEWREKLGNEISGVSETGH